jgi:hypothetical protein
MKNLIENYTFNHVTGTVTFNGYTTISLEKVLIITNVTRGTVIFNFACPGMTGSVTGNVLKLSYDVTAFADTDKLLIYYEDGVQESTVVELIETMRYLIKTLSTIGSAQGVVADIRVTPLSLPTLATVTNLNQLGGITTINMPDNLQNLAAVNSNINNVAR